MYFIRRTPYLALLSLFFMVLLLSSCGSKRKVAHGGRGTGRPITEGRGTAVLTDASDARGKVLNASKMDNYASLLGVDVRDLDNKQLYHFIDDWMGCPHQLGGTQKSGVDCSAFVSILFQQVYRKDLPRTSRDMGEQVKRKYERELKEGDLIFFSFGGKTIDHVGVYLRNNKFVHVSTRKGVIISNIKDSWYYKYFVRGGSPKI
ncbi:lipoprotein Spr [Sphingobacterium psychroaquaticum]|uniref:Lipoprotein Spr n=2 Tax=Sphingobacterium psychroaquaticum TaxID=561061 RepID=A0A1X7L4D0_9SPHI|nr:lipoprotein Spr [Sphingobacterium psychroaquaticum]